MNINWNKAVFHPFIGGIAISGGLISAFLAIYRAIYPADGPWSSNDLLLISIFIVLVVVLLLLLYNYVHIELDKQSLRVYLIISSEDQKNDKLISKDFKQHMIELFKADGIDAKVIVPNACFRTHFIMRLSKFAQKGQSYFETLDWILMQRYMLKGNLLIFGEIVERPSKGTDKYFLENNHLIVTFDGIVSEKAIVHLQNSLGIDALRKQQIEKQYATEQIYDLSVFFVDLTEYLVGITHLMRNAFYSAYVLHSKLYERTSSGKRVHLYIDLEPCLNEEITTLVIESIRQGQFTKAKELLDSHIARFSNTELTAVLQAHYLVCSSNNIIQCKQNAKTALQILINAQKKASSQNTALLLYNRAYLHLLLEQYSEANKRYRAASKYSDERHMISIIEYCDYVLASKDKDYEHKTAEYVKGYALSRLHRTQEAVSMLSLVILHNDINSFFHKEAVKLLSTLSESKKAEDKESK